MAAQKTLLALGAHADDCPFGLAGTMLKAREMNYRVVILNLIGDYSIDLPDRSNEEFLQTITAVNGFHGVETRFLPFTHGELDVNPTVKEAVAEVVAEVQPDIGFHLWPKDTHADHVAAAPLCHSALQMAGRILKRPGIPSVWRRYSYDNGPCHTIDYAPNTFVDVTSVWEEARRWIGEICVAYRNEPCLKDKEQPAMRSKETIVAYRGLSCGVKYAEAFHTDAHTPAGALEI